MHPGGEVVVVVVVVVDVVVVQLDAGPGCPVEQSVCVHSPVEVPQNVGPLQLQPTLHVLEFWVQSFVVSSQVHLQFPVQAIGAAVVVVVVVVVTPVHWLMMS